MSLDLVLEVGTYSGNGSTQSISIGWQPAVVIILSSRRGGPATGRAFSLKTTTMAGDDFLASNTAGEYVTTNGVTLTSTGFDLGSEDQVNRNTVDFFWLAIREGPHISTGSYTGDASDPRTISVGGKQPALVYLARTGTDDVLWHKNALMTTDWAASFVTQLAISNPFITLVSGGFEVEDTVNLTSNTYHWFAMSALPGSTRHWRGGTYTGDDSDPRTIAVGIQPLFIFISHGGDPGVAELNYTTIDVADDMGGRLQDAWNWDPNSNVMQSIASGIDVGGDMNSSSHVYSWIAGLQ